MSVLAAVLQARLVAGSAAATVPTPAPVAVVVDAAVVDRQGLAARLVAGAEPLGRRLSTPPPRASIVVTGELLDFRVQVAAPGMGGSTWSSHCPCTHAELVAHVQQRLRQALLARPTAPAAPRVPPSAAADPTAGPGPGPSADPRGEPSLREGDARRSRPRPRLARRGRLGAALLGLGGAGLGAGTAVMLASHRAQDESFLFHVRAEHRPYGLAAMAVGSGVLASGVVLLLLDRRHRRARLATHP